MTARKHVTSGPTQRRLSNKDVERFRQRLTAKRQELVEDVTALSAEATPEPDPGDEPRAPIHPADASIGAADQERAFGLVESERELLREIDAALDRIDQGTYGICEATGVPITKARLESEPWARYAVRAARHFERPLPRC